jgi:CheY-like chemotaxis protein
MTTVLVIEDTQDIRELIVQTLILYKYNALAAKNGNEGLELAEKEQPDLIICDIMMPHLNGYDVFKRLFDAGIVPITPFIFLTALDNRNDIRRGMVLGADDYIIKPFAPKDLIASLESVLLRREILARAYSQADSNYDIFISYSHDDRQNMHLVREALQEANFDVWTDEKIEPSRDWAEAIAEMIKNSACVVAVLSENAAQSTWVGRELGYAEANNTRIFPILLHGEENKCIPLRLINHQFIDLRQDFGEIKKLIGAIRGHLHLLADD